MLERTFAKPLTDERRRELVVQQARLDLRKVERSVEPREVDDRQPRVATGANDTPRLAQLRVVVPRVTDNRAALVGQPIRHPTESRTRMAR